MRSLVISLVLLSMLAAGCTGGGGSPSGGADADNDGLSDLAETTPHAITIATQNGTITRIVTSDPHLADTDGDGLTDAQEYILGSDPRSVDTDGDGLLDGHDITLRADSPLVPQWRALHLIERPPLTFLGELDQCKDIGGLKANEWSSDRPLADKLGDGEEILGWNVTVRGVTRHVASDPCVADTDHDGLVDDQEKALGTDPTLADTDGDGVGDAQDADPLANLGLAFANVTGPAGAQVRWQAGANVTTLALSTSAGQAALDVDDHGPRGSYPLTILLTATDADGKALDLFDGSRGGVILTLDILKDASGAESYHGADGSLAFTWSVTRA